MESVEKAKIEVVEGPGRVTVGRVARRAPSERILASQSPFGRKRQTGDYWTRTEGTDRALDYGGRAGRQTYWAMRLPLPLPPEPSPCT
jgi:hypothetical protein